MSVEIVTGISGVLVVLTLIALKFPIGVAMITVSIAGISMLTNYDAAMGSATSISFEMASNWTFSAMPMFLLMGFVAAEAKLTQSLFNSLQVFVRRLPGGLAVASVCASGVFAAASGSSVATTSAMARIAVPEMLKHNYSPSLATGAVASAGGLGALIPPSILLLTYGIYSQTSVVKLFLAGILPGLLTVFLFSAMIIIRVMINPNLAPKSPPIKLSFADYCSHLWAIFPIASIIVCVIGGIFMGFFTPTEAGAFGAFLAILVAFLKNSLSLKVLNTAVTKSLVSTASIFLILVGTILFTRFLALSDIPEAISQLLLGTEFNQALFFLSLTALFIILGMFVDPIGLLMLTLPFVLPIANDAGLNLIWLGIIAVKLLEIGLITPPVGLNVYVINSAVGRSVSLRTIFSGAAWFVVMDLFIVLLLILFPEISLYMTR